MASAITLALVLQVSSLAQAQQAHCCAQKPADAQVVQSTRDGSTAMSAPAPHDKSAVHVTVKFVLRMPKKPFDLSGFDAAKSKSAISLSDMTDARADHVASLQPGSYHPNVDVCYGRECETRH